MSSHEKQQWLEGQFFGVVSQASELGMSREDVQEAFSIAMGEYYPRSYNSQKEE